MQEDLRLSAYHYHLPKDRIAQHPADRRDQSRLMVVDPPGGVVSHRTFTAIADLISAEDLLVINDTRVFPARLLGRKESGGKAEVFLLDYPRTARPDNGRASARALLKSSKRPKPGSRILFAEDFYAILTEESPEGTVTLQLHYPRESGLSGALQRFGQVPLPPYISRTEGTTAADAERYQTVYAEAFGAVAAPTAGLHFTAELLSTITSRGTLLGRVTLHVGYGTFAPVRDEDITQHRIHSEYLSIPPETVAMVTRTRARGGRVWAVGTTSVRALEYGARHGALQAGQGWCDLYIYPGYQFRVVDNLITNFHLPDSSLLFLVAAFCGRKTLLDCYQQAIAMGYRFFSYGDAMAIIGSRQGKGGGKRTSLRQE